MLSLWREGECQSHCMERDYCGLSPQIADGMLCVILRAFVDDSSTEESYIVAGYVAPLDDWTAFSKQWYSVLKQPPKLGYYRTSDALALKKEFRLFTPDSRDKRIASLAKVILDNSHIYGVRSWVSKSEFEELWSPTFHPK